jgi:hypothetical protein
MAAILQQLSNPSAQNPVAVAAACGNLQQATNVFNQYLSVLNLQASVAGI